MSYIQVQHKVVYLKGSQCPWCASTQQNIRYPPNFGEYEVLNACLGFSKQMDIILSFLKWYQGNLFQTQLRNWYTKHPLWMLQFHYNQISQNIIVILHDK